MFDRRTFLAGLTATTVLSSRALAAARELPELAFHVVTDTHLGRQDSETPTRQWKTAAAELAEAKGKFVLHLGDIVDSGREPQYPIYAEIRQSIGKPVYEVPGNHDPVEFFTRYVRPQVDTSFVSGGVRFVLFNNSARDSHLGFIKPDQIAWLRAELTSAAKSDEFVVLVCHVPVHKNLAPDRGWYVKPADGQTDFYTAVDEHQGRVLAVFHGHFHNGIRGWNDHKPVVEVCFPSNCYNQDRGLVNHPKLEGFVVDELRAGYTNVTIAGGKMTLEYKPLKVAANGRYEWGIQS